MDQKFKLKTEARQFFDEKFSKEIEPARWWESHRIHLNALEAMPEVYVSYGHKSSKSTDLCGWSSLDHPDAGSHFLFTIHFPSHSIEEYRRRENRIKDLLDQIQMLANDFDFGMEEGGEDE